MSFAEICLCKRGDICAKEVIFVQKRSYLCKRGHICAKEVIFVQKRGICWLFAGRLCKRASIASVRSSCRRNFVQEGYSSAKQIYFCKIDLFLHKQFSPKKKRGIHKRFSPEKKEFTFNRIHFQGNSQNKISGDRRLTLCHKTLQHTATHCNTLQHTATHCNTLQHTATHCNTLQHTATHV